METERKNGTVKFFNEEKGFGFITDEDGKDHYVKFSAIKKAGYQTLEAGEWVTFEEAQGQKGSEAKRVIPE